MTSAFYPGLWGATLTCQLRFMELPAQDTPDDLHNMNIEVDEEGFQASFVRLHTTAKIVADDESTLEDPKQYLVSQLSQVNPSLISKALADQPGMPEMVNLLRGYGIPV